MCPVYLVCFFGITCIKPRCVFYTYTTCFFNEKRQTTVKFRHPVFAGLPSLHYGGLTAFAHLLRSGNPAPPRNHSTCSTSSPFRRSDYISFIATFALDLRINGFGRSCTLRHRCPPDGPPSLNVNLTLKSQEYISNVYVRLYFI